jgi:hypothetical protein
MPGGNMTRNTAQIADAEVARKMFFGGCLCLPWLWIVNTFHFRQHLFRSDANPDVQKWVRKSFVGAIVASIALFSWVLYFQLNWRKMANGKDLLLIIPNEDMDQW